MVCKFRQLKSGVNFLYETKTDLGNYTVDLSMFKFNIFKDNNLILKCEPTTSIKGLLNIKEQISNTYNVEDNNSTEVGYLYYKKTLGWTNIWLT